VAVFSKLFAIILRSFLTLCRVNYEHIIYKVMITLVIVRPFQNNDGKMFLLKFGEYQPLKFKIASS